MNAVLDLMNHPLPHRAGWVLLHSLWQGALAAAVFSLLRFALLRRSARARYLAGCFMLVLLAVAPFVTFLRQAPVAALTSQGEHLGIPASAGTRADLEWSRPLAAGGGMTPFLFQGAGILEGAAPWLAAIWAGGVLVFAFRLLQGCWWVKKLRTLEVEPLELAWLAVLEDLKCRLNISRPVRLLKSALVEVPTLVGWLRPMILLPASSITGLTPAQLEAILAHELAHLRRCDYLVNAFQNVVETLMFYHPTVWWISRCIREEREHCCDDLVVGVCGDRVVYARALATLEELRAVSPQLTFAASGIL